MSDMLKVVIGLGAAFLTALVSLLVSLITRKTSLQNQTKAGEQTKELAELQDILEGRRALLAARNEYRYKASIRLYEEYEPLLFQLVEASEDALFRIVSLARAARIGQIRHDGSGWLGGEGYYLTSTVYRILCPVAVFSIVRRKLTLVDLTVDSHIASEYDYAKRLYVSLSDDFEFARVEPSLEYDPFSGCSDDVLRSDPARYRRQGVAIGSIDNAADALITDREAGRPAIMTLGQFATAISDKSSDVWRHVAEMVDIFTGFHPATRPVLWRSLITMAHLYRSFLATRDARMSRPTHGSLPWECFPPGSRTEFDWRAEPTEAGDDIVDEPFDVAQSYLRKHLLPVEQCPAVT